MITQVRVVLPLRQEAVMLRTQEVGAGVLAAIDLESD